HRSRTVWTGDGGCWFLALALGVSFLKCLLIPTYFCWFGLQIASPLSIRAAGGAGHRVT
uniref:Uncharacterized protein n=1 Tax=Gopherus evgoodei TaxID=1825980 RepID=A0A8C4VGI0_9SAUR